MHMLRGGEGPLPAEMVRHHRGEAGLMVANLGGVAEGPLLARARRAAGDGGTRGGLRANRRGARRVRAAARVQSLSRE